MRIPETIASAANPLLKDVRRAIARGSLTAEGWCVAETFHLLEEALRSPCEVRTVIAAAGKRSALEAFAPRLDGIRTVLLPDALFEALSATETSQGVMALVEPPAWKFEQLLRGKALVVVLDGLQDPGNAGTIARAAEAFGATGILYLKGGVSPHNPKTLRASAGSLFRIPFLHGVACATALATLRQNGVKLFAAMPAASPESALSGTDLTGRCALVVGSEAHGVSAEWLAIAAPVSIPTVGVESLNAAIAAAVLLYEARRQRVLHP